MFSCQFCHIASILLESAATTASLERCFSTAKWINSKLRNKLSVESIKMLAFCARVLRNRVKNDAEDSEAENSSEDGEEELDADVYQSDDE